MLLLPSSPIANDDNRPSIPQYTLGRNERAADHRATTLLKPAIAQRILVEDFKLLGAQR